MRPTRSETDLEYWANAVQYWREKIQTYLLLDNREGETRCKAHLFRAELNHQEAQGLIIVYSGRRNPRWA